MTTKFNASTAAHAHRKVREAGSLKRLKQDPLGSEALRELRRQIFLAEFLLAQRETDHSLSDAHKTIAAFAVLANRLISQLLGVKT